jgi:chromate reductase
VLKNATDWLSRGSAFIKWKRVGIVGAGDGHYLGTGRSQYHLRQNLQALQAIVMPRPEIFVNHNSEKFDKDGNLTDAGTREHLGKWLTAFIEWVEKKP